jgi:drug/metabolite transporter (DMT)-like permease
VTRFPRPIDPPGAFLAILVSAFWGANSVAIKLALEDIPPIRLAWVRFLLGGAAILVWAAVTGRLATVRLAPGEWRPLVVVALLFTAQIVSMNIGTSLTSAAHAAVILNSYVVHTVVLAHFLVPGDRLTPRGLAGVLTGYLGVVLLFVRAGGGPSATLAGDLIMFGSAFLLAERTVYLARAVHSIEPVKLLLAQATLGTALFFLVSSLTEAHEPTRWTGALVVSIVYQGVVVAGFNFVVNLWLLRRYAPTTLAAFFLTQPLFGVLAAALLAGDRLTVDLLLASLAVVLGMWLTRRPAGRAGRGGV